MWCHENKIRVKLAPKNYDEFSKLALVEISLFQLHIIDTFSDNSSEMCHGEWKLKSRVKRDDDEYFESANDLDDIDGVSSPPP